ncbi:MAG: response regulator [Bryobacteraceae bacterium]|nr:response regulator [Bryobacteraceae bacterium]
MKGKIPLLLVEDNPADVFLVEEAIKEHRLPVQLLVVEDGEAAIRFLDRANADASSIPNVVVLDWNLPRRSGSEVLQHLRTNTRFPDVPVIVFTSSDSRWDRELAAQLGATRYFRKSADFDEFMEIGHVIEEVLTKRRPCPA